MQDRPPSPRTLLLLAVVFEGGLGLLAVALGWWLGPRPLESIGWTFSAAAYGAAASLPMMVVFGACLRVPIRPFLKMVRVVDELLVPMFRHCRVWQLALIAALAGLGEEMLFRGVIQEATAGWIGGPLGIWVGLAVAGVLFGLLHPFTPAYALLAGLMGLYLGWLWLATGNLLVPISAHAVYDFLALVYLVNIRGRKAGVGDRQESVDAPEWLP